MKPHQAKGQWGLLQQPLAGLPKGKRDKANHCASIGRPVLPVCTARAMLQSQRPLGERLLCRSWQDVSAGQAGQGVAQGKGSRRFWSREDPVL